MDCSPSGSSVHRILQVRILERVAIPFSRGSSWLRDWTWIFCIGGRFFTIWVTREASKTLKECLLGEVPELPAPTQPISFILRPMSSTNSSPSLSPPHNTSCLLYAQSCLLIEYEIVSFHLDAMGNDVWITAWEFKLYYGSTGPERRKKCFDYYTKQTELDVREIPGCANFQVHEFPLS